MWVEEKLLVMRLKVVVSFEKGPKQHTFKQNNETYVIVKNNREKWKEGCTNYALLVTVFE